MTARVRIYKHKASIFVKEENYLAAWYITMLLSTCFILSCSECLYMLNKVSTQYFGAIETWQKKQKFVMKFTPFNTSTDALN